MSIPSQIKFEYISEVWAYLHSNPIIIKSVKLLDTINVIQELCQKVWQKCYACNKVYKFILPERLIIDYYQLFMCQSNSWFLPSYFATVFDKAMTGLSIWTKCFYMFVCGQTQCLLVLKITFIFVIPKKQALPTNPFIMR